MLFRLLIILPLFSSTLLAQYTARQGESVTLAWTFDPVINGTPLQFRVDRSVSSAGPWVAAQTLAGTARESSPMAINFSSGTNKLYFRVVGIDQGLDGANRDGEPSSVIDFTRVLGSPGNPKVK